MLTMVWYGLSYFTSGLSESVVSFLHVNIFLFFICFLENQRNLPYLFTYETYYNLKANKERYIWQFH